MGFRRGAQLAFSRFGRLGRAMLRRDNVSLPHLQNKVIIGRVESSNEEGFYTVNSGFKRCARESPRSRAVSARARSPPRPAPPKKTKNKSADRTVPSLPPP